MWKTDVEGGCGRRMWKADVEGGCGEADVEGGCGRRMWGGGCGEADAGRRMWKADVEGGCGEADAGRRMRGGGCGRRMRGGPDPNTLLTFNPKWGSGGYPHWGVWACSAAVPPPIRRNTLGSLLLVLAVAALA